MEKAKCPVCNQVRAVTAAGAFKKHSRSIWHGGSNYETLPCEGKPPGAVIAVNKPVQVVPKVQAAPPVVRIMGVKSSAPRGALEAQRKAYESRGLTWSPQAIAEAAKRHTRK